MFVHKFIIAIFVGVTVFDVSGAITTFSHGIIAVILAIVIGIISRSGSWGRPRGRFWVGSCGWSWGKVTAAEEIDVAVVIAVAVATKKVKWKQISAIISLITVSMNTISTIVVIIILRIIIVVIAVIIIIFIIIICWMIVNIVVIMTPKIH